MTQQELISTLAKLEGKKHQAPVGDLREIWSILKKLEKQTGGEVSALLIKGAARAKTKKASAT